MSKCDIDDLCLDKSKRKRIITFIVSPSYANFDFYFCTNTLVIIIIKFMTADSRVKQALKWWSYRQAMRFFLEAETIRDGLLQESFTIRRRLDLLTTNTHHFSYEKTQEWLNKFENFHHSLVQLSERLCPASIQDSLPLSIEYLLETWFTSHPNLYFHVDMPMAWRQESTERSLIILRAIEELLKIAIPPGLTKPISIYISLRNKDDLGLLKVQITYPNISSLLAYSNLPELEYLCESFKILMSGKCFCYSSNLRVDWYFCW
jgi:hypothetical protein